ncbi:MAG: hypothetical protein R3E77_12560 [Steroidobacteraceae bacterium]
MAEIARIVATVSLLLGLACAARADEQRAHFNYMMQCQGCHLPDASGVTGKVPQLRDVVGQFLHSAEGRAFVIQVPGVAGTPLDDAQLAELINWLLRRFSAAQLPSDFVPYTASEVARLRAHPDPDPEKHREQLLRDIAVAVGRPPPATAHEIAPRG